MGDEGEIRCDSGKMSSSAKLTVKKGEGIPVIDFPDEVEGPCNKPLIFEVPFKSKCFR